MILWACIIFFLGQPVMAIEKIPSQEKCQAVGNDIAKIMSEETKKPRENFAFLCMVPSDPV